MDPKLLKMLAALGEAMTPAPADRDEKAISKLLTDIAAYAESPEAKAYGNTDQLKDLAGTIGQLRKDLDENARQLRELQRAGLEIQGGQVQVLGFEEIMSLRRVRRVWRSEARAEQFGALCARSLWGGTGKYNDIVAPRTRDLAERLIKDLDPGLSGSGAELLAHQYMADLIAHVEAVGVLFPQAHRVPLSTLGTTSWPKLTGEVTATPLAVATQIAESTPTLGTVAMSPVKWGVLTPVPNEFFRDPTLLVQLGQLLGWLMTRAIAYAADDALVNGDGTATYGTIDGILNNANISAIPASAAATIAAYTGAQVGDVIAGVTKDYVDDPQWFMHLSSSRTLRNIRSTVGPPLYERGGNGEPNTIDNYPYSLCQRFPAAAGVAGSTKWGAFGSLRLAYYFGMLGSVQVEQSPHARFESDQTVVRGIANFDAALKDGDALVTMQTHS